MVLYGGAGSGKSHFSAQKLCERIVTGIKEGVKHRFLVLRKTGPAAKQSVYPLIEHYIREFDLWKICQRNMTEMAFNFADGSKIICGGLDDPEKLKSFEGMTSAWLEEPTQFTREDFIQVDLRLRGETPSYKQIILTFNPISRLSWAYKEFFETPSADAFVLRTTYKDNAFLDDDYIARLKRLEHEDKNYYRIYALGEWGELKGVIYNNYEVVKESDWPVSFDETIYGLDFGYNNPTALIEESVKDGEVWERELLYQSNLTNQDLIGRLGELIPDRNLCIYADSAEPQRIEEIRRAGFNIYESNKSVKDGIDYCRRLKFHIHPASVNLIKEVQGYKYKEDKDGNSLEEPLKFMDHCFVGSQPILTVDGEKEIADVIPGDYVFTRGGKCKVLGSWLTNKRTEVYEYILYTDNGDKIVLVCTPDHLVFTKKGWIEVCRVNQGDVILMYRNLMEGNIISIEEKGIFQVIPKDCIELFGNIITERYQSDTIFTTKTEIQETMQSITSNSLSKVNIYRNIQNTIYRSIARKEKNIWIESEKRLKYGIKVMQEENGIGNMQDVFNSDIATCQKHCAKIAVLNINRQTTVQDSAATNVNQRGEENQESTISNVLAKYAANNLLKTDTVIRSLVQGRVERVYARYKGMKRVYNIHVCDFNEFIAGGVLVHNSMDGRRYAVFTHNKRPTWKPIISVGEPR